jgi:hypothetical protein
MRNPETMLRVYEELAARFVKQNEPRLRDHCLVLAADSALTAGRAEDAERLRQRLLQYNPHHLLRPFASMAEAMQAPDVQEYVADLRRQWPPEFVQKLYLGSADEPPPFEPPSDAPAAPKSASMPAPTAAPIPPPIPMQPVHEPAPPTRPAQAKVVDSPPPRRAVAAPQNVFRPAAAPTVPPPVAPARLTPVRPSAASSPGFNPVGLWLATMLYWLGIAIGVALFAAAFVWPLVD